MAHVGHLRLAMPTAHALAQTCVLLCPPSVPIEPSLSLLPGFVISQGLNCPFLIINHDTLQIKGLAKNPYYHIWAPGYLAIMFMS